MTRDSLKRDVISGGAWAVAGRIGTALAGLAVSVLLARLLPRRDMGTFLVLASVVATAATISQMGLNQAVVRLTASALALGRAGQAADAARAVLRGGAMASLVLGIVFALGAARELVPPLLRPLLETSGILPVLAGLWLVSQALQALLGETFRGFQHIGQATLFNGLASNGLLALMLGGVWADGRTATLTFVVGAATVCGFVAAAAAFAAWRRLLQPLGTALRPRGGTAGRDEWRALAASAWPFWVTSVAALVTAGADLWVLSAFRPAAEVAVYGIAVRTAALLAIPLQISNAFVTPLIARLYVTARHEELQRMLRRTATAGGAASLLGLLAIALLGGPLLGHVFGPAYHGGGSLLTILAAGQCVNVLAGSCGLTLLMTGNHRPMMGITVACGALTVVGALAVARAEGAFGIACVTSGAIMLQNVGMLLAARAKTGLWTCASLRALPLRT